MGINAVAVGAADYVLVHRALHNPPGRYHRYGSNRAPGGRQWTAPYGHVGPAGVALPYREYLERYGATREEMATLVVNSRKNVADNPQAYWYQKPIEKDDYLNARMIAEPICMLDCDIPVDGAAAFILTSAERARDTPHKPVYIAGYVQSHSDGPSQFNTLDRIMEPCLRAGKQLWEATGLRPEDVDCPQIYDGFSPLTYWWLEGLGFCKVGEAHSFVQDGRIDRNGKFPLLSGGGNLGNGRIHGIPHIRECYLQLSGRAGHRQLAKATVGISSHSYPNTGSALVYTSEPI
jgi:acetyl-CoA acetyltransferase